MERDHAPEQPTVCQWLITAQAINRVQPIRLSGFPCGFLPCRVIV